MFTGYNLKYITSIVFFFVFALSTTFTSAQIEDQQFPLPPNSIHLSGYLENDIRNSITNWNKGVVPYSKFVDFFRYGRDKFALGEMWGKAVRSGCMFYRYTQDPELKNILDITVQDMLSVQRANGSISCVEIEQQPDGPGGDMWERKYVMLGLEEYYEWVNADPKVLESLRRQADCILSQVGGTPKVSITDLGWSPNHIESSTLLEPFMRLYKWTKHKPYLDFATYIVESGGSKGYNLFEQAYNNIDPYKMGGPYPKAYEMMSLFEGLVEYYRVTGDPKLQKAILNLYNNIKNKEITIIGNAGADLPYHPAVMGEAWDNTAIEQTNPDIKRMMETCVGVTWLKYCSQIVRLTGDSSPMDEIEKYVYNGLLGAMKPTGDGFSYVNLLNGQKVNTVGWGTTFGDLSVTCCNLNGPMGLAYIPYIAVTNSNAGPVVNLYNAGKISMTTPGRHPLHLVIDTEYPKSEKVVIKVDPGNVERFTLQLRIPAWSKTTIVKVNGKKQLATPGKYAEINRDWKPGDRIEISFDIRCRLVDAPYGSNRKGDNFQAVIWGPIVLARDENIDPNYDHPVTIKRGKDGYVKISREKPTLNTTRMEFSVPTTKGKIRMVDYSSVNGWQGSGICTWLPKEGN
ncbi:beta-L-arabinofuranosidase domain-containing protein [Parabacteroides sp. Marseille-P3160]|uniref:beta-L-arabinofuranosidase domain-containing protein n=1 Tax=Parabacteroides sp. Marseille-P3160 TaxID=1917887 RepID=UPI0009BBE84B|nr:beta-L-arabinofuranosidase domain-containing protein [Parabacteroides sp. Marseille-P3160]